MKKSVLFFALLFICIAGCKTYKSAYVSKPQAIAADKKDSALPSNTPSQEKTDFSSPETWLLGYFRPEQFTRQPHSQWYIPGYDQYRYDENVIMKLLNLDKEDDSILIVMGTWCSDSRREVPRFMKILTAINFPPDRVRILGVDNMKKTPVDNYESLEIIRVPTFIFYVKNIEVGRIIENPLTSLEQDMMNILTGK
ncbi:MAG: hypothetical protein ACUVTX_01035 [Bacteroidales bacterium]